MVLNVFNMVWMRHMKTNEAVSYCLSRGKKVSSRNIPSKHFDLSFRIIRGIKLTNRLTCSCLCISRSRCFIIEKTTLNQWHGHNNSMNQLNRRCDVKKRVFGVKARIKWSEQWQLKISEWEGTGEEWDEWETTTTQINSKATDSLWVSRET